MLDIRSAVGTGCREEESVDGVQELPQVVGDLRLPVAVLKGLPRAETYLLRLDRRREHHVFGLLHG